MKVNIEKLLAAVKLSALTNIPPTLPSLSTSEKQPKSRQSSLNSIS